MKCVPNFEYVSHQLACSECRLDDTLSLTVKEIFGPFSSVPYLGSHIPTSKDTIYYPFAQMCCKCSFIAPSSQAVHP